MTLTANLFNSLDAGHRAAAIQQADINLPAILEMREALTGNALYDFHVRKAHRAVTTGIYATSDRATQVNFENVLLRESLLKICRLLAQAVEPFGSVDIDLTDGDDHGVADRCITEAKERRHGVVA